MSGPLFSVVIPCFNVAATLAETVASVRCQTLGDLEIVAVDNNSTDGTAALLASLARDEPRLRIVHEPVQGLSAARNGGIRAARGRYIAFLDGDDLLDPDYLQAHAANLADGRVGVSYSRIRLIDAASQPTGNVTNPPMRGVSATTLLRGNPCTSMVVVRREVLDRVGHFDESLRRVEDMEWLFRAAAGGFTFRGIDRAIAGYRITSGGLSQNLDAMLASHLQMLEAAARVAPALVARHRRLSRAAMLRYCARRAVDHAAGSSTARAYLRRMLGLAPDLVVREPLATLKTIAAVLAPGLVRSRAPGGRGASAQPGGAA